MTIPEDYPFYRYLSAKKTVDDRALNKNVWQSLSRAVSTHSGERPLRILEIGAGIGTMVERALDWGLIAQAEYLALDSMVENITHASTRVPEWASGQGFIVENLDAHRFAMSRAGQRLALQFEAADVFDFIAKDRNDEGWDLLIANAFLDLVDVPAALPDLFSLLRPGGLFYFSVTFDGCTILQPETDRVLDMLIEALYHETMDSRIINNKPSGDSRTGRHFFQHVKAAGAELLDAGASDWVVFSGADGYPRRRSILPPLHHSHHGIGSSGPSGTGCRNV